MATERESAKEAAARAERELDYDFAMFADDVDGPVPEYVDVERFDNGPPAPEVPPTGGEGVPLRSMCRGCVAFVAGDPVARRRHRCVFRHRGGNRGAGACLWCEAHNRACVEHPAAVTSLVDKFEAEIRHIARKCENGSSLVGAEVMAQNRARDIQEAVWGNAAAPVLAVDGEGTEESPLVVG